jgi:hypothetical protein
VIEISVDRIWDRIEDKRNIVGYSKRLRRRKRGGVEMEEAIRVYVSQTSHRAYHMGVEVSTRLWSKSTRRFYDSRETLLDKHDALNTLQVFVTGVQLRAVVPGGRVYHRVGHV